MFGSAPSRTYDEHVRSVRRSTDSIEHGGSIVSAYKFLDVSADYSSNSTDSTAIQHIFNPHCLNFLRNFAEFVLKGSNICALIISVSDELTRPGLARYSLTTVITINRMSDKW